MEVSFVFIALGMLIMGSALYVLFTKNVVYAAFSLMITFLGVAGIFVLSNADFLAVSQIMIYIGGILILLVFGVFLTQKHAEKQTNKPMGIASSNYNRILALVVSMMLFGTLFKLFSTIPFQLLEGRHFENIEPQKSSVQKLGLNLIIEHSIAVEVIAILLLGALIGAGYIAKKTIEKS